MISVRQRVEGSVAFLRTLVAIMVAVVASPLWNTAQAQQRPDSVRASQPPATVGAPVPTPVIAPASGAQPPARNVPATTGLRSKAPLSSKRAFLYSVLLPGLRTIEARSWLVRGAVRQRRVGSHGDAASYGRRCARSTPISRRHTARQLRGPGHRHGYQVQPPGEIPGLTPPIWCAPGVCTPRIGLRSLRSTTCSQGPTRLFGAIVGYARATLGHAHDARSIGDGVVSLLATNTTGSDARSHTPAAQVTAWRLAADHAMRRPRTTGTR